MAIRINFHDGGRGSKMFDILMQAFSKENGYVAEHYDGFYARKPKWESELTGWLGAHGFPCIGWQEFPRDPFDLSKMGIELEDNVALLFWLKWT